MDIKHIELIDIYGLGLKGVFHNSFGEKYSKEDELYAFEGNEVELTGFHFDYRIQQNEGDPDPENFPMIKMRIQTGDGWHESCAWCDEITPVPPLITIYLSALALGSKHNLETIDQYEELSAVENPYPLATQEHNIFKLGFSAYFFKK
ncbi:hypothetical protein [Photobacterium damselae]|uniref:hypothetical protein n=1 Tax=Photobacterium damselae TaxID=38293 RepID=UPI00406820C4